MTYTTYFLKFSSKEESETKLDEAGYKTTYTDLDETEKVVYRIPDVPGDIDIVGEIYNNDAVYSDPDPETGEITIITPPTKLDGWHVNIILEGELPEVLQEFVVTPQNPYRVFA
jgi:hypothetical protein